MCAATAYARQVSNAASGPQACSINHLLLSLTPCVLNAWERGESPPEDSGLETEPGEELPVKLADVVVAKFVCDH